MTKAIIYFNRILFLFIFAFTSNSLFFEYGPGFFRWLGDSFAFGILIPMSFSALMFDLLYLRVSERQSNRKSYIILLGFVTTLLLYEIYSTSNFRNASAFSIIEGMLTPQQSELDIEAVANDLAFDTSQIDRDIAFDTSQIDRDITFANPLALEPIVEPEVIIVEDSAFFDWYLIYRVFVVCVLLVAFPLRHLLLEKIYVDPIQPIGEEELLDGLAGSDEYRHVSRALNIQARAHRSKANFLLALMVALILIGVQLYRTAGALVSNDVGVNALTQTLALNDRLNLQQSQVTRLISEDLAERQLNLDLFVAIGNSELTFPEVKTAPLFLGVESCRFITALLAEKFPNLDSVALINVESGQCEDVAILSLLLDRDDNLRERIAISEAQLASVNTALDGVRSFLGDKLGDLVLQKPTPEEINQQLIASGITRFGILFVVIYLVQILVGVYRFSMRQAEFYEARANAMLLVPKRSEDLGRWKDDLLATHIDFGKAPMSPAQHVNNLVNRVFSRGKKDPDES